MKITKAQSRENRARILETASALFREHGYAGVSVAELMTAAGLTHGGFYKHFRSKADLIAQTAELGIPQIPGQAEGAGIGQFIDFYLSRAHRDDRTDGCTMAALSGDAARQPAEIKTTFAAGIESRVGMVERGDMMPAGGTQGQVRAQVLSLFAHMLGAVVLSRACPDDSALADEILAVCRQRILAALAMPAGRPAVGGNRHND